MGCPGHRYGGAFYWLLGAVIMSASQQAIAAVRAYRKGYTWGPAPTVAFLEKRGAWRHYLCVIGFEQRRKSKPARAASKC